MRSMFVAVLLATLMVSTSFAGTDIYGFGSLNVPTHNGEEYNFSWMRLGASHVFDADTTVGIKAEYDLSTQTMKYGHVWKELNESWTVTAGQFLNPPQYSYPGPKSIRLPYWPFAEGEFTVYATGVMATYSDSIFTARVAHFGDQRFSAQVEVEVQGAADMTLYWEEGVGFGATVEQNVHWYLNPSAGLAHYTNDTHAAAFFQNCVKLKPNLCLYGQVDIGTNEPDDTRWLGGATYEWQKDSFVRLYYEAPAEQTLASVSFAF